MTLTVTTWNLENFTSESPAFKDKLQHLKETLAALNPDVVALQEVLDVAALKKLGKALGYKHASARPDRRGNRVAFLFRSAPVEVQDVADWRLPGNAVVHDIGASGDVVDIPKLSRPALQATIEHGGKRVTFLNAHLKSKLLTYPSSGQPRFVPRSEAERANVAYFALRRRSAEARTLREHVTEILARGDEVITLGDLNDVEDAATTQLLYGPEGSNLRGPEDVNNPNSAFSSGAMTTTRSGCST
jgi:endonuclease/exonuclease/phosphatase family metal-dependent hydrolase